MPQAWPERHTEAGGVATEPADLPRRPATRRQYCRLHRRSRAGHPALRRALRAKGRAPNTTACARSTFCASSQCQRLSTAIAKNEERWRPYRFDEQRGHAPPPVTAGFAMLTRSACQRHITATPLARDSALVSSNGASAIAEQPEERFAAGAAHNSGDRTATFSNAAVLSTAPPLPAHQAQLVSQQQRRGLHCWKHEHRLAAGAAHT